VRATLTERERLRVCGGGGEGGLYKTKTHARAHTHRQRPRTGMKHSHPPTHPHTQHIGAPQRGRTCSCPPRSAPARRRADPGSAAHTPSICMNVQMYVCMYVCISVHLYICMSVCLYVCMYIHTYIRMCYVLTNPPIPSSRCKDFVVLRPAENLLRE